MFKILEVSDRKAPVLEHSDDVFHRALADGGDYYHVKCDFGDYDIEYIENDEALNNEILKKSGVVKFLPSYRHYDETDTDTLYLRFLSLYKAIYFEGIDEYVLAFSRTALANSDLEIFCLDSRIEKFLGKHDKLHVIDALPEKYPEKSLLINKERPDPNVNYGTKTLPSIFVFHNVFFVQGLLDGKDPKKIKYLEYAAEQRSGIASIIMRLYAFKNAFAEFGIKVGLKRGSGKYGDEMVDKYFDLDRLPDDANETNTVYLQSSTTLVATMFYTLADKNFSVDVIKPAFKAEMDEYYDAVFGGKKVLGLLIRGTDYLTTNQRGERIMAGVANMVPEINKWLEEDGYDLIFLASEDADICEQMIKEYGPKLRLLSQERHRVSDFTDVTIISDLEKKERTGRDYEIALADTTINYFYALYLLSKCDSFMCSGQCNGYDMVLAFNQNKFDRLYKFNISGETMMG
ncbi:MAG: hypothetical protein IJ062_10605 [Firmicutes bacterium]|nr:hypothetical protein [Bacillota bacterium]